ncbi:hypothetical protein [Streptomyces sp. NBC_00344]|uniref:hypothetical protein n=1 Tax=Streptomyces sp. NBC_00344 TaxID=2975720 RepID=UPI002E1F5A5F
MTRLIPLILIALGIYFWFRARQKTTAYLDRMQDGETSHGPDSGTRNPDVPDHPAGPDRI